MKPSELTGAALDWAVAKADGVKVTVIEGQIVWPEDYEPSTDWAQGGPIIERFGVGVYQYRGAWSAHCPLSNGGLHACMENQPTPLIAAMRCYVASKLGAEVDVPKELTP